MILSVKTTGLLGRFLPEESSRNLGDVELADNSSVRTLLQQLGIPDDGRCHVTLNGTMLQAEEIDSTILSETDQVVLMAPLTAG